MLIELLFHRTVVKLLFVKSEIHIDRLFRANQTDGSILQIVKVASVGDVIVISSEDLVLLHLFLARVVHLILTVHEFTSQERPSDEIASLIESREKSIPLTPDQVLVLLVHADTIDQVQMWEWDHSDVREV